MFNGDGGRGKRKEVECYSIQIQANAWDITEGGEQQRETRGDG